MRMDLLMLDIDIFSDDDDDDFLIEEIERRPYVLRNRPQHFQIWDDVDFFSRFRLKKDTVLMLLQSIEEHLLIFWNKTRSLTPINQLLLTLRFYATGSFLRASGDFAGVSITTASNIIKKVSEAIASQCPLKIEMPTNVQERRSIQQGFYNMHRFPRVIGCIDGTHIRIQSPGGEDAEVFRNRKGYFSMNVQAVVDHNMKVRDIVARWPGSAHDATIFMHSNLRRRLEQGEFQSGLLLGDSGYPVKNYLLTPLRNPNTEREMRYNNSHIRTRNIVERFFGVWKRRFPVLSLGMRVKLETVQDIIVATAVLHNMARDQGEDEPPEQVELQLDENVHNAIALEPNEGRDNRVREAIIAEYFSRLM